MKDEAKVKIFISHSSSDKPFARRLGNNLRGRGASVWIDEVEIKIGDSLIQKISEGLEENNCLIIILSKASCSSEWVKREVNIALTKEIQGKTIRVYPILLEDCDIPTFLIDKKYADFRTNKNYSTAREELISALGLQDIDKTKIFLDQHIFYDLEDLNNGFDVPLIKYFSEEDFKIVLDRCKHFNIEIFGIEPWPDGKFGDVVICEEYSTFPSDPKWYFSAFENFLKEGIKSHFSATYGVPKKILKKFAK